jgi:hypothetical protein
MMPESSLFVGDGFDAVGTDETGVFIDWLAFNVRDVMSSTANSTT